MKRFATAFIHGDPLLNAEFYHDRLGVLFNDIRENINGKLLVGHHVGDTFPFFDFVNGPYRMIPIKPFHGIDLLPFCRVLAPGWP